MKMEQPTQVLEDEIRGRARILIVDDDEMIRKLLRETLERHGYEALEAPDAATALAQQEVLPADLIILDVMMPGEDGLSLCRRLASRDGPWILILSALGASGDRIAGLEVGADAYVAKPCDPRELIAEIRSLLRRGPDRVDAGPRVGRFIEFGAWRLDLVGRHLWSADGLATDLSATEFRLLRAFVERPRRVLSRDALLSLAYPSEPDVFDRAIDTQVSRLRRKLGAEGPAIIRTIRNEGYLFTPVVTRR